MRPQNSKQDFKNKTQNVEQKMMSPRPILGVLCVSSHEPNDKSLKEVLCETPECFKGVLGTSEGHMSYILMRERL